MITLYNFIAMNETEQANAVWNGTYLGDRFECDYVIQLYTVSTFYVEVFYDPKENKIIRFRPFKTNKLLDPYLNRIDL